MSTVARFDGARVEVNPGTEAACQLHVANQSQVVESYSFRPVGDLAEFARVDPEPLSLYPGTEGAVTVTFTVPRNGQVPAGEVPFAVVVTPHEHPDDTAVPEAVADVAAYTETVGELTPRTSQARLRAKHWLAVDNKSNHTVRAIISGEDPDDHLAIRCRPDALVIAPGHAAFAKVRVRARRPLWKGQPQARQFRLLLRVEDAGLFPFGWAPGEERQGEEVGPEDEGARPEYVGARPEADGGGPPGGEPDEGGRLETAPTAPPPARPQVDLAETPPQPINGSFVQKPIFPPGTGKFLALALAGLLALVALWFALLRPTIRSAAQQAAKEPVAQAKKEAAQAKKQAEQAKKQAAAAGGTADKAAEAAEKAEAQQESTLAAKPFNRRMVVSAKPGESAAETFVVPKKQIADVTDLVFQSRGDSGTVRLLRDKYVLFAAHPQDFRTLDQHFVSPIVYAAGQKMIFELECAKPTQQREKCQAALYIGGTIRPEPKVEPSSPASTSPSPPAPALPSPPPAAPSTSASPPPSARPSA